MTFNSSEIAIGNSSSQAGAPSPIPAPIATGQRLTRRRSSAGPLAPVRPQRPKEGYGAPQRPAYPMGGGGGMRPTFLTLRDHGKVFVADLPRLSDGQLAHVAKEVHEVLDSLTRRLAELETQSFLSQPEQDTRIRAATKRDVTERFIRAIAEEQDLRRNNPALRAAAGESLARAFLELARHRLPGSTFDSLLQEALEACGPNAEGAEEAHAANPVVPMVRPQALPVVLTPDVNEQIEAS
ncbi:hypothetical protein [Cyanobium sp. HWJ4-Hawea]|uniref:hypothetical protein n=1 Tax=Cyanobium sp. HWJ4-Hawea TaxID=2823713 RepID=UPI0020CE482A|nr:hypothetical protein [Cyanobium sp. HWJ4-Hawea]